jgi:predicted DNA-binding antitoxin AbrB/MazE fold protein
MSLTIEATYEDGVLKPSQPLLLHEHEKVQITIHTPASRVRASAGLIPCRDAALIEQIALEPIDDV